MNGRSNGQDPSLTPVLGDDELILLRVTIPFLDIRKSVLLLVTSAPTTLQSALKDLVSISHALESVGKGQRIAEWL